VSWDQILIAILVVAVIAVLAAVNIYYAHKYGFFRWLGGKKRVIAVVMCWSLVIAVILIREYWLSYIRNPILFNMPFYWFDDPSWVARLDVWDFIIILVTSATAGALILDIEAILFSAISNAVLSFLIPVIYVTFFIWVILGWGNQFDLVGGFGRWGQYVIWDSIRIIFRMTFPIVQLLAFFGAFIGAFVRGYFQPSAES
jgi:hypothetical protein